jgi:hypothetical protein
MGFSNKGESERNTLLRTPRLRVIFRCHSSSDHFNSPRRSEPSVTSLRPRPGHPSGHPSCPPPDLDKVVNSRKVANTTTATPTRSGGRSSEVRREELLARPSSRCLTWDYPTRRQNFGTKRHQSHHRFDEEERSGRFQAREGRL